MMKSTRYLKAAVAALAMLGATTLAAPSHATLLTDAAKTAIEGIAAKPTAEQRAVLKLMEKVSPGSLTTLRQMVREAPDVGTLATNVEAYTLLNPSLLAVIENGFAVFVADPRLAGHIGSCAPETALNTHSLVRIWCGLPALEAYPQRPDPAELTPAAAPGG